MIAPKETLEAEATASLPNLRKVYIAGELHPEIAVIPSRADDEGPHKSRLTSPCLL